MADFREKTDRLQAKYTTNELKDALAERIGRRATSVNPLTEAMFHQIVPETQPIEYAQRSDGYSDDMSRVATNATALKMLLQGILKLTMTDDLSADYPEAATVI